MKHNDCGPATSTEESLTAQEDSKVNTSMSAQLTIVHGKEYSLQLTYGLESVLYSLHQRLDLE